MEVVLIVAMRKNSKEPWQVDAGVNNPTVPRVGNQAGAKNVNMPYSEPDCGPKVIHTKSEWVSCRPQRLGVTEEQ